MKTRILHIDQLREIGACYDAVERFLKLFGNYVEVTETLAITHAGDFDFNFAAQLLSPAARADYERMIALAWADYERMIAPARADYERMIAPAWADYERRIAPARADYERRIAPAWADYERMIAPARADYERMIAPAWARGYLEG